MGFRSGQPICLNPPSSLCPGGGTDSLLRQGETEEIKAEGMDGNLWTCHSQTNETDFSNVSSNLLCGKYSKTMSNSTLASL